MEWGDFSYLIFSSSHERLQFSPFLSISTAFLSFHFVFPSCKCLEVSRRSRRYRQVVQNPRGTSSAALLSFHNVLPLSSRFPYFPAVWHTEPGWISSFYLHRASGWYCALDLGWGQAYVHESGSFFFVSLHENVITLRFVNLKLTWLRLPKSATLKFQPSRFRKSLYPVEDCVSK